MFSIVEKGRQTTRPRLPICVTAHGLAQWMEHLHRPWSSGMVVWHGESKAPNHPFYHTYVLSMSCFVACKHSLDAVTRIGTRVDCILRNVAYCSPYPTPRTLCTGSHRGSKSALFCYYYVAHNTMNFV
jgi:hypothetical protein